MNERKKAKRQLNARGELLEEKGKIKATAPEMEVWRKGGREGREMLGKGSGRARIRWHLL